MGQERQHTTDGGASAMRRKTDRGRAAHQARAMSLAKALRITLAKVADDLFSLPMAILAARIEDRAGDALSPVLEDDSLLVLLDGPMGRTGGAVMDPALVGALIQQQTMGKVLPDPGGTARRMTDTDAAITASFLDALLKRAAPLPDSDADKQLLTGYRFGSRMENARLLAMALEAPDYRIVTLTVDIAGGVRQGRITLCLPVPDAPQGRDLPGEDGAEGDAPPPGAAPDDLSGTVMALNVDLVVSLARLRMPLGQLGGLRVGDALPLGCADFDQAQVMTLAGKRLAKGVLGQMDGHRALRLVQAPAAHDAPRRRASDRADLDQREPAPLRQEEPAPDAMPDLGDLPELDLDDPEATGIDPSDAGPPQLKAG